MLRSFVAHDVVRQRLLYGLARPQLSAQTPTFPNWDRLPNELKLHVLTHYTYYEDDDLDAFQEISRLEHQRSVEALVAVGNKQFFAFAIEAYYKSNDFIIVVEHPGDLYDPRSRIVLSHPPAAYGHFIQRLEMSFDSYFGTVHAIDNQLSPSRFLLRPMRSLHLRNFTSTHTAKPKKWQNLFPTSKS